MSSRVSKDNELKHYAKWINKYRDTISLSAFNYLKSCGAYTVFFHHTHTLGIIRVENCFN